MFLGGRRRNFYFFFITTLKKIKNNNKRSNRDLIKRKEEEKKKIKEMSSKNEDNNASTGSKGSRGVTSSRGFFPLNSHSSVNLISEKPSQKMLTDGSERIEMYCPNPMCRRMQTFNPKGNVYFAHGRIGRLRPHQCKFCLGKQDFVENRISGDHWIPDTPQAENDYGGETMSTHKNFELEMFPQEGFQVPTEGNAPANPIQYFEEGVQIEHEALIGTKDYEQVYPQSWEKLQNAYKKFGKKASERAKWRAKNQVLDKSIFEASDKTLKWIDRVRVGNPMETEVFLPSLKIVEDEAVFDMEEMYEVWKESLFTCRKNCTRPHIHNSALKWSVSGTIPTEWYEEREKAVENANKKAEREGKPIEKETLKWIKIYIKKFGIENVSPENLEENEARSLLWELNETGRQNLAKKYPNDPKKAFDKSLLERGIQKLIRLCGNLSP